MARAGSRRRQRAPGRARGTAAPDALRWRHARTGENAHRPPIALLELGGEQEHRRVRDRVPHAPSRPTDTDPRCSPTHGPASQMPVDGIRAVAGPGATRRAPQGAYRPRGHGGTAPRASRAGRPRATGPPSSRATSSSVWRFTRALAAAQLQLPDAGRCGGEDRSALARCQRAVARDLRPAPRRAGVGPSRHGVRHVAGKTIVFAEEPTGALEEGPARRRSRRRR